MPDERFLILQMHELLSYLSQRGVLTILVLAQHGWLDPWIPVDISYLADGVLMLRYFEYRRPRTTGDSVVKKRSGNHEHSIREFRFSERGSARSALPGVQRHFSGTPEYHGEEGRPFMPRDADGQI